MAKVTVWRKDTPSGETFDDAYAKTQGFNSAEAFAQSLISTAGYSANPQTLAPAFGGGIPSPTGNEISFGSSQFKGFDFSINTSEMETVAGDYIDARDVGQAVQDGPNTFEQAKALYPYLDERLVRIYLDKFNESGNERLAIAEMRADPLTAEVYPGIKRDDGSLRMTEQEYIAAKDNMRASLRDYNLNATEFEDDMTSAISGDVSPLEFKQRLDAGYEGVVNNIPQVKQAYLDNFGIDLPDESIFAMFVSPTVAKNILEGNIRASQVIGEAEVAGFGNISAQVAQSLSQQGLTQEAARKGFGAASLSLMGIQSSAASQGRESVTASEYVQATQLGNAEELQNLQNIITQIETESSLSTGAAKAQTGEVVGLTES